MKELILGRKTRVDMVGDVECCRRCNCSWKDEVRS